MKAIRNINSMTSFIMKPEVSVIIPVHNGSEWLDDCFNGILSQTFLSFARLEVSIYNDGSTDNTDDIIAHWQSKLLKVPNVDIVVSKGKGSPKGVGFAKNRAIEQSSGSFLCFQDVDDVMLPQRISLQLQEAKAYPNSIIGSNFVRDPPESTARFTRWANCLSQDQLLLQIYTSHGPTVIMPTWFCSKTIVQRVGGFSEDGKGTPEDLIFFYKHLDLGGSVRRVNESLLIYRYHQHATTFSILEDTIWNVRIERLIDKVLQQWSNFTIWNAGKQGRKFYRSLPPFLQERVSGMCDVDEKKIGKSYRPYYPEDPEKSRTCMPIPITSFSSAKPPFVICVKLDLTAGNFETNLESLGLKEGEDYVIFS